MLVKSLASAPPYDAPNHHLIDSVRLLGFEPGGPEAFWVGHSTIQPGGSAGPDASPREKVYVVLSGSIVVRAGDEIRTLKPLDACRIAPHEVRTLTNPFATPATFLVILPTQ